MALSILDIFTIGIGTSSRHTVAPMVAARRFAELVTTMWRAAPARILVEFRGTLGAAGRGHRADRAVMLGLMGFSPETVDVAAIGHLVDQVRHSGKIALPD